MRCKANPGALTITLPFGSWNCSRDMFRKIAGAIKEWSAAVGVLEMEEDDARYLELVAEAIIAAVDREDTQEQKRIARIFKG